MRSKANSRRFKNIISSYALYVPASLTVYRSGCAHTGVSGEWTHERVGIDKANNRREKVFNRYRCFPIKIPEPIDGFPSP